MEQLYIVTRRELKASKRHPGETYWHIELLGCDDLISYTTYVSDENRNYTAWRDLCESRNSCHVISFPKGVKIKPGHIINADTRIEINLSRPDWDEAKYAIGTYWSEGISQLSSWGKIEVFDEVTRRLGISL